MPGLTGLQVAERLGTDAAHAPLIVFVTAYSEYAVQAFEREAVDYLVKPISEERWSLESRMFFLCEFNQV